MGVLAVTGMRSGLRYAPKKRLVPAQPAREDTMIPRDMTCVVDGVGVGEIDIFLDDRTVISEKHGMPTGHVVFRQGCTGHERLI